MRDLAHLLLEHSVLLVLVVTFLARAGVPLPAAPLLVMAGGLAADSRVPIGLVIAASLLANLAGDAVWFVAGRRYGRGVMRLLCRLSLSPDSCVRQSETLISRWGGRSLAAAKFVPGVSVVAAPMAGALGMSWGRFVAYDLVASLSWTVVFLGAGWLLRDQIELALAVIAQAGGAAAALLGLALLAWLGQRYWRRRRVMRHTTVPRITTDELHGLMARTPGPVVIDVRGAGVAADPRRIPGARAMALAEIEQGAHSLPADRDIVLYCNCPNEVSAALAALALRRHGVHKARALAGGLDGWLREGLPFEEATATPAEAFPLQTTNAARARSPGGL